MIFVSRYTATVNLRCEKAHTCIGCGGRFAYTMSRKLVGTGASAQSAQKSADKRAAKAVLSDVDVLPCPSCGLYQPDMIGNERLKWHKWTAVAALIPLVVLLILHACHALRDDSILLGASAWCALVAVTGFFVDLRNRNGNLDANQRRSERQVADGRVRRIEPGNSVASAPAAPKALGMMAFALGIGAVLLVYLPEFMRGEAGWPLNDNAFPPVVGPGDETVIYLGQTITSIKGYWRGSAVAHGQIVGQDKAAPIRIPAATSTDNWGNSISVKSSEKSTSTHPWVRLIFPKNDDLGGKTVDCDATLNLAFPQLMGGNNFVVQNGHFNLHTRLQMAPAAAGKRYTSLWWLGFTGGAGLLIASVVARIWNAKLLARQALPTELLALAGT